MNDTASTAETDDELFGLSVRRWREERGWSMADLNDRLIQEGLANFHPTTVGRIERGERPVRLIEAKAIAAVLNATVEELLGEPMRRPHSSGVVTGWATPNMVRRALDAAQPGKNWLDATGELGSDQQAWDDMEAGINAVMGEIQTEERRRMVAQIARHQGEVEDPKSTLKVLTLHDTVGTAFARGMDLAMETITEVSL